MSFTRSSKCSPTPGCERSRHLHIRIAPLLSSMVPRHPGKKKIWNATALSSYSGYTVFTDILIYGMLRSTNSNKRPTGPIYPLRRSHRKLGIPTNSQAWTNSRLEKEPLHTTLNQREKGKIWTQQRDPDQGPLLSTYPGTRVPGIPGYPGTDSHPLSVPSTFHLELQGCEVEAPDTGGHCWSHTYLVPEQLSPHTVPGTSAVSLPTAGAVARGLEFNLPAGTPIQAH
eukprot:548137-Rhodomonas_salina.1